MFIVITIFIIVVVVVQGHGTIYCKSQDAELGHLNPSHENFFDLVPPIPTKW